MLLPILKRSDILNYITLKDESRYCFDSMKIMGIINVTPDSFYEKSRVQSVESAVNTAVKMIDDGADFIDIGGESTRPGSNPVTEEEEIDRVVPAVKEIRKINSRILISVDTYRSKTAEEVLKAGADIINDISALTFDCNMADVVSFYKAPVILMHIKGTPKNMQKNPYYKDVFKEVTGFLKERIEYAESKGINHDRIIIDPGIGFGKNFEHNIELIKRIGEFQSLNCPVLLAVSRKTTIGRATGAQESKDRLPGTIAVTCYAAMHGVDLVRVHDVLENRQAAMMMECLK